MSPVKIFDQDYFADLTDRARSNLRLRQHDNIHYSYNDPVQRLFNAIEPESYIRPHRHWSDPRAELLVAIRGKMALMLFDDDGNTLDIHPLGVGCDDTVSVSAVELNPSTWHTVIALVPDCVLLEIKAGPFDPKQRKDLAPWAPEEEAKMAVRDYQRHLFQQLQGKLTK